MKSSSENSPNLVAPSKKDLSVAALIHGCAWASTVNSFSLDNRISFCQLEGTVVNERYQHLCADQNVDNGEPFMYNAFFLLKPKTNLDFFLDFGEAFSTVDRLSNILTVVSGEPVSMCRVMWSFDNFYQSASTDVVHVLRGQSDFLSTGWVSVTDQLASDIATAWSITQQLWEKDKSQGRIANALAFFYTSWRSHYIEHICLNLAVAVEMLFAPHSQSETTHQIAFNVSRFLSELPSERERLYYLTKRFYSVRSSIIHGGIPRDDKIIDVTVEMFRLTTSALRRIFLDKHLAATFNDDNKRRALLNSYLFR